MYGDYLNDIYLCGRCRDQQRKGTAQIIRELISKWEKETILTGEEYARTDAR